MSPNALCCLFCCLLPRPPQHKAIVYFTPTDWSAAKDGGALKCFLGCGPRDATGETAKETLEVEPVSGRLVLFKSRDIPHAVLPLKSGRPRLALSCWLLKP